MENLAVTHDPRSWAEFFYHAKEAQLLKNCLISNKQPFSIFVSGSTGVGKTSLIKLYLRALHCQNRPAGSADPCGTCPVCQADPRTTGSINNVTWVQRGKDDTIATQVNKALEESFQPPYGYDEEHRYYKAIVFDELQSIPKDKLQDLLFYPELPDVIDRNRVIFIFLTMDESRIDPVICQALKDRSVYLPLKRLSEQQIQEFLNKKFPDAHEESLSLISRAANGSLRGALSILQKCLILSPNLHPFDVADTLYLATATKRKRLWELLESCGAFAGNYAALWSLWQTLESEVNVDRLIEQLDDDLDLSMCIRPLPDSLKARMILYEYKTSYARIRPWDVIKMLAGLRCMNYQLFDDHSLVSLMRSGWEQLNDSIAS